MWHGHGDDTFVATAEDIVAELKTKKTDASVEEFLSKVTPQQRQDDAREVCAIMAEVSGEEPVMWGPSIVGFGTDELTYASGRTVDWMKVGFSPRKAALTLYLSCDIAQLADQLAPLGKYTTGKGCLYIKKLDDIDRPALANLIEVALSTTGV